MDIITLETKEQLDIYMNPRRQKLMRLLEQSREARTAKDLSVELGISASSVQHHLKKLESLGLVYIDHTANIRGITAKYYKVCRVTVHIGAERDDSLSNERVLLLKNLVAAVLDDTIASAFGKVGESTGDVLTGTVHLTSEHGDELQKIIREFLEVNAIPSAETEPWEYALIYHRTDG